MHLRDYHFAATGRISHACAMAVLLAILVRPATGQLRIVSYNTTTTIGSSMGEVLEAIGNESVNGISRPIDILAVQEQVGLSTTTQEILNILNSIYGSGTYRRSQVSAPGSIRQAVIYNSDTVDLLEERQVGSISSSGNVRPTLRYLFRPDGYGPEANLYIYNSHYKAGQEDTNADRRAVEAINNRMNADALPADSSIIYLGDFNMYTSAEEGFQTLTSSGPAQAIDPIDRIGTWHNRSSFKSVHTQSTTTSSADGRAGGGMDDRFDFQLVTSELLDGVGLSYIGAGVPNLSQPNVQHSYRAFGNDGSHFFNGNISSGTGASPSVLQALERQSDHLPVVADYQLPALMNVELDEVPPRVFLGDDITLALSVSNDAPAQTILGADELEFVAFSSGAGSLSVSDSIRATEPAKVYEMPLLTSIAGTVSGPFEVVATSPQASNGIFRTTLEFDVLARGDASFSSEEDLNEIMIDVGDVLLDDPQQLAIPIFNLESVPDYTGEVKLAISSLSGDVGAVNAIFSPTQVTAGGLFEIDASIAPMEPGEFSASFTIATRDEDINGALPGDDLVLTIFGKALRNLAGDTDLDGDVDSADRTTLATNWTGALMDGVGDRTFKQGDFDADGDVDSADVTLQVINWTGAASASSEEFAGANSNSFTIPEPSSDVMMFFAVALSLAIARKSQ